MMTDRELRIKVERELRTLKAEFPRRNIISPRAQQFLEKIRWLEYLLDLPHASIDEIVGQPSPMMASTQPLCVSG